MFDLIFDFIYEKKREADVRFKQKKLDTLFKADYDCITKVTPEMERVFDFLSIDEPIKLVCDYDIPSFDDPKYNLDPFLLNELQNNSSQNFEIAVYTEKTNQKLGYLPLFTNVKAERYYNDGSYNREIHILLQKNVKLYAMLVYIERNNNPFKPIDRYSNPNFRPLEKIYISTLHINTDLNKLKINAKRRQQSLESVRMEREKIPGKNNSILKNNSKSAYYEDNFGDSHSVWDEYDEDGVPYDDYDRDNTFNDSFDDLDEEPKVSQPKNSNKELDNRSIWVDYDEDGVPYEDY